MYKVQFQTPTMNILGGTETDLIKIIYQNNVLLFINIFIQTKMQGIQKFKPRQELI